MNVPASSILWVLIALFFLLYVAELPQVASDGSKDSFGGAGRLADEDIERIADRVGERCNPPQQQMRQLIIDGTL